MPSLPSRNKISAIAVKLRKKHISTFSCPVQFGVISSICSRCFTYNFILKFKFLSHSKCNQLYLTQKFQARANKLIVRHFSILNNCFRDNFSNINILKTPKLKKCCPEDFCPIISTRLFEVL